MFNSNGIDQRVCDLQVRPSIRGVDAVTLAGRTQVAASSIDQSRCVHIIFEGQSTNNNSIDGTYVPTHGSAIFNMSLQHRGALFLGQDPLLSGDIVQGHHGLRLADMLISAGAVDRVLLTNASFGGSYAADHCPGGGLVGGLNSPGQVPGDIAYRIGLTARTIFAAGFWNMKTIIDFQLGIWDSDPTHTVQANYQAALAGIVAEYKRVGLLRAGNVMFLHQETRIGNSSTDRNPIRAAQAAIPDGALVRLGFDNDSLDATYRQADATHFNNTTGAAAQATGKLPFHTNFILNG